MRRLRVKGANSETRFPGLESVSPVGFRIPHEEEVGGTLTYIVGTIIDGVGFIVADMRVSFGKLGSNHAIKTGVIMPGCIFGISGDPRSARAFLSDVRFRYEKEGISRWDYVERALQFASIEEDFELVICSRHSGVVQLYRLSSSDRKVYGPLGDTVTLGSGKQRLDGDLSQFEGGELYRHWRALSARGYPPSAAGYLYCLWLIERSRGEEGPKLEEEGVGGVFQYVWQDSTDENCQGPAVYLLHNYRDSTCYFFRVAYVESGGVVVIDSVSGNSLTIDAFARPDLLGKDPKSPEMSAIAAACYKEIREEQFYHFLGVGHERDDWRSGRITHLCVNGQPLLDWDCERIPSASELGTLLARDRALLEQQKPAPVGLENTVERGFDDALAERSGLAFSLAVSVDASVSLGMSDIVFFRFVERHDDSERTRLETNNGLYLLIDRWGALALRGVDGGLVWTLRGPRWEASQVFSVAFGVAEQVDGSHIAYIFSNGDLQMSQVPSSGESRGVGVGIFGGRGTGRLIVQDFGVSGKIPTWAILQRISEQHERERGKVMIEVPVGKAGVCPP